MTLTSGRTHLILVAALVATAWSGAHAASGVVSHPIDIGPFELIESGGGQTVAVEGFGRIGEAGKPLLPGKILALAIPPGAELKAVRVEAGEAVPLEGTYSIPPTPLARPIGHPSSATYEQLQEAWQAAHDAAYGSDLPYPAEPAWLVRRAGFRKYDLVDVRVAPFRYRPLSGRLEYFPTLTVHLDYSMPDDPVAAPEESIPTCEHRARELIANYDQAQGWYGRPGGLQPNQGHDLVIITSDSLVQAVAPLVNHEMNKSRTPAVVTVQWIDANATGVDRAARIRSFLREVYLGFAWGVRDVLLVGSLGMVPMRECWVDLGYGRPRTDFYYAELSAPDSSSWDLNGDLRYGEDGVDQVDMYSEVNVGRIPWGDADTVRRICQKSVAYEHNQDPAYKRNILVMGAFFWEDTDTAILMETKLAEPWMSDWTATRLYENNADYQSSYPHDLPLNGANAMTAWTGGHYAFVNWAGHGSPTSAHILGLSMPAFIDTADCPALDDRYPAIIWADSCSTANPLHPNLGREMLGQGAVGYVGATAVAGGAARWQDPSDGSSQSCDYWFTVKVTSGELTQGAAHQWSLAKLYTDGLWGWPSYEIFEWTLYGSPTLALGELSYPDAIFVDDFESGTSSAWSTTIR